MLTTPTETTKLDLTQIRAQFPSLAQTVNGHPAIFLDGPGGTQVPQRVIDAISHYLAIRQPNRTTAAPSAAAIAVINMSPPSAASTAM